MTEGIDNRLANRILWGLLVGAIAGGITLLAGNFFPDLLPAVRRFATLVLDPLGNAAPDGLANPLQAPKPAPCRTARPGHAGQETSR